jgi:RNA-directed DNA polymerase
MELLMGNTEGALESESVYTRQQRIAKLAKQMPDAGFTSLAYYVDLKWLEEAYRRTRKDGAAGVDDVTAAQYEVDLRNNLSSLLERFKSGSYFAPPVKRAYIPKEVGGEPIRPIGIPTLEDKILQRAVVMLLSPLYEQDFLDCSYGSRPGRNALQALEALWRAIMGMGSVCWVLEVDLKSYFDTVKHEYLREFYKKRVRDGVVTRVLGKWLKAGVMEDGALHYPKEGTPQGGVISPLFANIYLHEVLDVWFEREVRSRLKGRAELIRFSDDFVIVFSNEDDAYRVCEGLPKRFERFGLTIHDTKTRLVDFRHPGGSNNEPEVFDFLGFTHHWSKSRKGKWVVKRKTAKKKLKQAVRRVYEWCKRNRHKPVKEQWRTLSRKLHGHYGYYGVTFNSCGVKSFYEQAKRSWRKWLNRRSRNKDMPWERFNRLLKRYPLPTPRIVHQYS